MVNNIKRSTKAFAIMPLLLLLIEEILWMLDDSGRQSFLWISYIAIFVLTIHLIIENKKSDWLYSIVLVLILLTSIGRLFKITHWPFAGPMLLCGLVGSTIMAYIFLHNAFYLIIENKKNGWLYSIILVLILLVIIGSIFKTMHWPFAGPILLCGLVGTLIIVCLLLYNARNAVSKNIRYEQLAIGLCMFMQLTLVYGIVFYDSPILVLGKLLYYPMVALCAAILLKNKYVNLGERNLILYLLVYSLFIVIKQTFQLFT